MFTISTAAGSAVCSPGAMLIGCLEVVLALGGKFCEFTVSPLGPSVHFRDTRRLDDRLGWRGVPAVKSGSPCLPPISSTSGILGTFLRESVDSGSSFWKDGRLGEVSVRSNRPDSACLWTR